MIQRIQSLYLTIALLLAILGFFLDWAVYNVGDQSYVFRPFGGVERVDNAVLSFLLALLVGLIFATILRFKKRKAQMRSAQMAVITSVLVLIGFAVEHYLNIARFSELEAFSISYGIGVILPLVSAVLCWMSYKAIKKDEELVRSVDRLR